MKTRPVLVVVSALMWAFVSVDVAHADPAGQGGGAPGVPVTLVNHSDDWRFRRGTNEPPADWHTVADGALDASWETGPGGFGFGDMDDATILGDMQGNYTTVYIRQSFVLASAVGSNVLLRLVMDYDDGFVAFLDGVEIARSSNMGAPGTPVPYTSTASPDHPASVDGGAIESLALGPVGDRLGAGTHVLALIGLNGDLPSSDVTLIADLETYEPDPGTTLVSGPIAVDTTWSPAMETIVVTGNVSVQPGATLTIAAGTLIRMDPGTAIQGTGGNIEIAGTEEDKVVIERSNPASDWDEISVTGSGSTMTIRHADISGGEVSWLADTVGLMEDTYVHHYSPTGSRIVNAVSAAMVTLRRCHVSNYHETLFRLTLTVVEDCLFELAINPSSDAIDYDSAPPGSIIRRCTFRRGLQTNTDAIDLGPTAGISTMGTLIEDCVMHDFTDKGVSIGDFARNDGATWNCVIRNSLIYNTTIGIQVKGESDATIYNTVIVDADVGLDGFEKNAGTGGGIFTNTYNNILYNVDSPIRVEGAPRPTYIVVNYSDIQGVNYPGIGNINADPLFRSAVDRDYRLLAGSPCIGTGMGGVDMGITYPIGGLPAHPLNLAIGLVESSQATLSWEDVSDNETGFVIEHSLDGNTWTVVGESLRNTTSVVVMQEFNTAVVHSFRIYGTNFIGRSLYSDVATDSVNPNDNDGDGMPNDWELANGLNPNDPSDASGDADMDGSTNLHEFQAGTDPNDPLSVFRVTSVLKPSANRVELRFPAASNTTYSILYRDSLSEGPWVKLLDVPSESFAREYVANDFIFGVVNTRYYQVVTPAQP